MAYSKVRRFVAGAVCPQCSEMDKIVVYRDDEKDFRECVSCGYKEEMRFKSTPRELTTRVNVTESDIANVVQIIQLPSSHKPN